MGLNIRLGVRNMDAITNARELNVNSSQPEGWNCVDCPDGDITKNASRG